MELRGRWKGLSHTLMRAGTCAQVSKSLVLAHRNGMEILKDYHIRVDRVAGGSAVSLSPVHLNLLKVPGTFQI